MVCIGGQKGVLCYTKAASGYWNHPRQTWPCDHSTKSPEGAPLHSLRDSAQASISLKASLITLHEIAITTSPAIPISSYPTWFISFCIMLLLVCFLSPSLISGPFLFGYRLIPSTLNRMAHHRYPHSRWPSMREIYNLYFIQDLSLGVNEVFFFKRSLSISIPKMLFISLLYQNWKCNRSWKAPTWNPHLKELTLQIRTSSATINCLSTDVF